jgi:hypothetical protein
MESSRASRDDEAIDSAVIKYIENAGQGEKQPPAFLLDLEELPPESHEAVEELSSELLGTVEGLEASLLAAINELESELALEISAPSEITEEAPSPTSEEPHLPDPNMEMLLESRVSSQKGAGKKHEDFTVDRRAKSLPDGAQKLSPKKDRLARRILDREFRFKKDRLSLDHFDKPPVKKIPNNMEDHPRSFATHREPEYCAPNLLVLDEKRYNIEPKATLRLEKLVMAPLSLHPDQDNGVMRVETTDDASINKTPPVTSDDLCLQRPEKSFLSPQKISTAQSEKVQEKSKKESHPESLTQKKLGHRETLRASMVFYIREKTDVGKEFADKPIDMGITNSPSKVRLSKPKKTSFFPQENPEENPEKMQNDFKQQEYHVLKQKHTRCEDIPRSSGDLMKTTVRRESAEKQPGQMAIWKETESTESMINMDFNDNEKSVKFIDMHSNDLKKHKQYTGLKTYMQMRFRG